VVARWKRIPILLTLEQLEGGTNSNIKFVIMVVLRTFGGLIDE
jgi:hypothetical protein